MNHSNAHDHYNSLTADQIIADVNTCSDKIEAVTGMRMVVFSLILLAIILFRREGIMGTREITWKTIFSLGRRKA